MIRVKLNSDDYFAFVMDEILIFFFSLLDHSDSFQNVIQSIDSQISFP